MCRPGGSCPNSPTALQSSWLVDWVIEIDWFKRRAKSLGEIEDAYYTLYTVCWVYRNYNGQWEILKGGNGHLLCDKVAWIKFDPRKAERFIYYMTPAALAWHLLRARLSEMDSMDGLDLFCGFIGKRLCNVLCDDMMAWPYIRYSLCGHVKLTPILTSLKHYWFYTFQTLLLTY